MISTNNFKQKGQFNRWLLTYKQWLCWIMSHRGIKWLRPNDEHDFAIYKILNLTKAKLPKEIWLNNNVHYSFFYYCDRPWGRGSHKHLKLELETQETARFGCERPFYSETRSNLTTLINLSSTRKEADNHALCDNVVGFSNSAQ